MRGFGVSRRFAAASLRFLQCPSTPPPYSSARSCCSWCSRWSRSRSCRGSAARPRSGRRASSFSRRHCLQVMPTRTSSCAASAHARRSRSTRCCWSPPSPYCRSSPAPTGNPTGAESPSWLILGLLAATIGLPYFLLSTTSPLVQVWYARARPGASPYRLFALSNLASMLALVGYPFLFEPWAPTRTQAWAWSAGYVLFVGLCAAAGWSSVKRVAVPQPFPGVPSRRTHRNATSRRRRPSPARCSGARSRPPGRCCSSRYPTTSRRTSRPCRSSGSRRSRSISSPSSSASTARGGTGATPLSRCWRRDFASWAGRSPTRNSRTSSASRSACSAAGSSSPACSAMASS